MKRSLCTTMLTIVLAFSTTSQASACCLCIPYIPWLDPFAWLGFYGCGGGYSCGFSWGHSAGWGGGGWGYGYGYGGYAPPVYGYGARQPVMPSYQPVVQTPIYAPIQQVTQAGCDCNGQVQSAYTAPVQTMTAVQVPVTTYRAVTQYVPQTTYQTQYQPIQQVQSAYLPQTYGGVNYAAAPPVQQTYQAPAVTYAAPAFSQPAMQVTPGVQASPGMVYQYGDITGDHQLPAQSANVPIIPNSHSGQVPVRRISQSLSPQSSRQFPASVR